MVKKAHCICISRPNCVYPHTYPLGTPQISNPKSPQNYENRNVFEVGIEALKAIDPKTYFNTTGDLVSKLKILERDATTLAVEARKLIALAKKTQGKSQFLETSIDVDGKIFCQPKTMLVERARREGQNAESRGAAARRSIDKKGMGLAPK